MPNANSVFSLKQVVILALRLLSSRDRKWLTVMASLQALIGLLDLVGIVFLGALSSVVLNGLSSRSYGDRLGQFLEFLKIDNNDFNFQILIGTKQCAKLFLLDVSSLHYMFFLSFCSFLYSGVCSDI